MPARFAFLLLSSLLACVTPHRDPVTVVGRTFDVQFDEEITEQMPRAKALDIVRRTLEKNLGAMQTDYPAAFARQVPRVRRIEVRQIGGEALEIATILEGPNAELRGGDVARALEKDFFRAVDPAFRDRPPEQIAPSEAADWFDWVRLDDAPPERIRMAVRRFADAGRASDPDLAARVQSWLTQTTPTD